MTVSRRILIRVACGVFFVVAVVTAVTYVLVYRSLKQRGLQHLAIYVAERTLREEARFDQIQVNLALARGQFLKRIEDPYAGDLEKDWNARFRFYEDGAWRSREEFKDGRKYAQMWAHKNWKPTDAVRTQTLVAEQLCAELLLGWVDSFPSVYFNFPGPVNIGYDARIPSWVWDMPADYNVDGPEWMSLALPKTPPPADKFLWTGVQRDIDLDTENPLINSPLVSVFLPIYRHDVFIGSVGHDMYVAQGLLDETVRCGIAGAYHTVFREDGRLLAHPKLKDRIIASKGLLLAQNTGDTEMLSLFKTCTARQERRFFGYDAGSDSYFAAARIAGPEWYFVTAMPQAYLQQQAFASAQWVLWSGLLSLGLVLGFIAAILRTQIARPLAELTRATEAMAHDTESVPVLPLRPDELGRFANSFRGMVTKVGERENELRQLNNDLERRVIDRTADLNHALASERELVEMKGNFVSLVSHEFRTPLGVILSATDVLQRYFERLPTEKRARHLDMILKSTRNLASLIEEVLLLGRVEQGRLDFSPEPIDLEAFCRSMADEVTSATNAACPIRFRAFTSLEGAVSDESVLRHILSNLLSNAVKYSAPGTPVEFTASRNYQDVMFTVHDEGIGILEEDQARLFTSFSRGGNVGGRPGTGLGLVVVHRCVQLHGGSIEIKSAVGQGTAATVTLPVFTQLTPSNPAS